MKIWRINMILKDTGNPPYTEELIMAEFQRFIDMQLTPQSEMHVMDIREVIPETFSPLVPKERVERGRCLGAPHCETDGHPITHSPNCPLSDGASDR